MRLTSPESIVKAEPGLREFLGRGRWRMRQLANCKDEAKVAEEGVAPCWRGDGCGRILVTKRTTQTRFCGRKVRQRILFRKPRESWELE